jgi:hypothetical protein
MSLPLFFYHRKSRHCDFILFARFVSLSFGSHSVGTIAPTTPHRQLAKAAVSKTLDDDRNLDLLFTRF